MDDEKHEVTADAFIAISDTHLGLRVTLPLASIGSDKFKNTVTSMPEYVDQFLSWIIHLERGGHYYLVDVCDKEGKICKKILKPPDKLILNGDIFELYDASDRVVEFASFSVLNRLSEIRAEKIYLVGNHDIAFGDLQKIPYNDIRNIAERKKLDQSLEDLDLDYNLARGKYPWGSSSLRIFGYTYPEQKTGNLDTLKVGDHSYLFLHGHQFNVLYGKWWLAPATLRDGSEAFRLYSLVIVALWIFTIIVGVLAGLSIFDPIFLISLLITSILAIPSIFAKIARPLWNRLKIGSYRYADHIDIQKTILNWWKRFLKKKEWQSPIHLVYGHTHKIGILESKDKSLVMINHPAWVKDVKKDRDEIIQAVFLYGDSDGFEFFGWDWGSKKPFHIPKKIVEFSRTKKRITSDEEMILRRLGWPEPLIKEWGKDTTYDHNMS